METNSPNGYINHALQPGNGWLPVTCKCAPTSRHHAAEADIEPIRIHVSIRKRNERRFDAEFQLSMY
jgi:hypothetical protein